MKTNNQKLLIAQYFQSFFSLFIYLFIALATFASCKKEGELENTSGLNSNPNQQSSLHAFKSVNITPGFQSPYSQCGSSVNPTGNPIGGGTGYNDIVNS